MTGLGPHCHLIMRSMPPFSFAYQVFTFVRFVARFRICTVGGGYDVLIVFNGGLIDVFPFVLLDGRLPIVNPICKARNATTLLQASPAATAARDNLQCDRLSRYCDRLSRYCDHWKKVDHKIRPTVVVETMFGRRLSGAPTCRDCGHLWGEGHNEPRLQLHNEPRLRPTNGQAKALRLLISASAPGHRPLMAQALLRYICWQSLDGRACPTQRRS